MYSIFQQQQQKLLWNLLLLYQKTRKRCVMITTKNLGISLFCKIFQDTHACIHREYLEIIELEQ